MWFDPIELIQIVVALGGMIYSWALLRDHRADQFYVREHGINGFARVITSERVTISIALLWAQIILLLTGCVMLTLRAGYLPAQLVPILETMRRDIPTDELTMLATVVLAASSLSRLALSALVTGISAYRRRCRLKLYDMHLEQQAADHATVRAEMADLKDRAAVAAVAAPLVVGEGLSAHPVVTKILDSIDENTSATAENTKKTGEQVQELKDTHDEQHGDGKP